ncbi:hypothetical protein EDD15DRAFT_2121162, partial [Pisolithus albus]
VDMQLAYMEQQCLDGTEQAVLHEVRRKAMCDKWVLCSATGEMIFKEGQLVQVHDMALNPMLSSSKKLQP